MLEQGQGRFNSIVVLDSVPQNEMSTALRLKSELDDIADYVSEGLDVQYFQVAERSEFASAISDLTAQTEMHGLMPWIHLDGHGARDESGLVLAGGEFLSWEELRETIVPLNIATDLNLVLFFATCYGGSFARSIRTTDRAPVLALIGPTQELTAGDVETDFPAFYRTFFETNSLKKATAALSERYGSGLYYRNTAEKFFYDAWASYKRQMCGAEALRKRAKDLRRRMKLETNDRVPGIASIVRTLKREEPRQFDMFRDTYFMYDLNEANRVRFPVTYQEAELKAKSR